MKLLLFVKKVVKIEQQLIVILFMCSIQITAATVWNTVLTFFSQSKMNELPEDLPEVVNDFDIEEEEIAIENRFVVAK